MFLNTSRKIRIKANNEKLFVGIYPAKFFHKIHLYGLKVPSRKIKFKKKSGFWNTKSYKMPKREFLGLGKKQIDIIKKQSEKLAKAIFK